jgi:hypothetical protein
MVLPDGPFVRSWRLANHSVPGSEGDPSTWCGMSTHRISRSHRSVEGHHLQPWHLQATVECCTIRDNAR